MERRRLRHAGDTYCQGEDAVRSFAYYAPQSVQEAIAVMQREGADGKILAGGTDLLVQLKERGLHPKYVLSLSQIAELKQIRVEEGTVRIGALVRCADACAHPVIRERYPVLVEGASIIGSFQIQNLATIAGNLCNAAPSADSAPPLMVLGARLRIAGPAGERVIPVEEFFVGPGRTVLQPGELVTEIILPPVPPHSGGHYLRHTPRAEMDIAVVGVGSFVVLEGTRVQDVRIALGAVAPTPIRARRAEEVLRGREPSAELIEQAGQIAAEEARPISDQRGSAEFRRHLVRVLTRRTLTRAIERAQAS